MNFYQHQDLARNTGSECAVIEIDADNRLTVQVYDGPQSDAALKFSGSIQLADNNSVIVINAPNGRVMLEPYALTSGTGVPLDQYSILLMNGYNCPTYFQVDTGSLARKEISVKAFIIPFARCSFIGDFQASLVEYATNNSARYLLWERCALSYKDLPELWSDERGFAISQGSLSSGQAPTLTLKLSEAEVDEAGQKYFVIGLAKYDAKFIAPRREDVDGNTFFVKATAGLQNTDRVQLKNGVGDFRLYPLGYLGPLKIKFGFKHYNPWCEYNLAIEE